MLGTLTCGLVQCSRMDAAAINGGGDVAVDVNGHPMEQQLERQCSRPADVDADMREMGRRKRVEAILNSKTFKSELDRLVEAGLIDGNSVGGCLQQISDMMGLAGGSPSRQQAAQCVQPIADLRGAEASQFSKQETMMRCKLASLFRVLDQYGWAATLHNHVTVRLSQDPEHFLVNPHGMLYGEMTASSLLKADVRGNIVHAGPTGMGLDGGEYAQHAAVHAARADVQCVVRVRAAPVVAVSALRPGLLPLTADAAALGQLARHAPGGDADPRRLAADLGASAKVLLLQNRGALCCGASVEEALFLVSRLVAACESQVRLLPLGLDNLVQLDEEQQRQEFEAVRRPPAQRPASDGQPQSPQPADWPVGELEFEALMRQMDKNGFRTGHVYRHSVRGASQPGDADNSTATGYRLDTDDVFKHSPMRRMLAGGRAGERTRWLNTPNLQQKVEVVETGAGDKTLTKVSAVKTDQ